MNERTPEIVVATAWYPPHTLGGTEIYVEGLVNELSSRGLRCAVLVPRAQGAPPSYEHRGVPVWTYPVDLDERRHRPGGSRRHGRFDRFEALLREAPDAIYHQHSWTTGCGLDHLRAARAQGMKTVLTAHVAAAVCLRGTMLHLGRTACDGRIEETRCGSCWAHSRGAILPAAWGLGRLPHRLSARMLRPNGRLATALSARALARRKAEELEEAFALSDRLVAVCGWLSSALASNGVPEEKLVLSRHGLEASYLAEAEQVAGERRGGPGLRLVYVGRWDRVKGIHVAVAALRKLPAQAAVELSIYGVPAAEDDGYQAEVRALAAGDPRIRFHEPRPHAQIARILAAHDVLLAPSLWLETGPLVVLEAQAAGLYVLGSDRGGIAELVRGRQGGELLAPGNVGQWSEAIGRLLELKTRGPLPRFEGHLRSQADVAEDMIGLYRSLWTSTGQQTRMTRPASRSDDTPALVPRP